MPQCQECGGWGGATGSGPDHGYDGPCHSGPFTPTEESVEFSGDTWFCWVRTRDGLICWATLGDFEIAKDSKVELSLLGQAVTLVPTKGQPNWGGRVAIPDRGDWETCECKITHISRGTRS